MDLLVKNLEALMESERFSSQPKLAHETGVSQTHIGNILRKDKVPSIEIVQRLANGLGLKTWQLLLPTKQFRKDPDSKLNDLLALYLATNQKGRDIILEAAAAQVSHNPASREP